MSISYLKYLRDLAFKEIKDCQKKECIIGRGEESRNDIIYWRNLLEEINNNGLKINL